MTDAAPAAAHPIWPTNKSAGRSGNKRAQTETSLEFSINVDLDRRGEVHIGSQAQLRFCGYRQILALHNDTSEPHQQAGAASLRLHAFGRARMKTVDCCLNGGAAASSYKWVGGKWKMGEMINDDKFAELSAIDRVDGCIWPEEERPG